MESLFAGTASLAVALLLVVLVALWIALPFALFGVKPLLRKLIDEQRTTNALLSERLPRHRDEMRD